MRRSLAALALAVASGLLLFASDTTVGAWPLLVVALLPVLAALRWLRPGRGGAALMGLALGLGYTVPVSLALEFPLLMAAGLAAFITAIWVLFCLGARVVSRWPAPWGGLGVGAVAVVAQYLGTTVLPAFGTAQSFARPWSAAPPAAQLAAVTGMLGLVFALAAAPALALALGRGPGRRAAAVALALVLAVPAAASALLWGRAPAGRVRVAAMGWVDEHLTGARNPRTQLARVYEPLLAEAVAGGATLVVSPEVGFWLEPEAKAGVLARLQELARRHRVSLAAGYFDVARNDNRIAFIGPDGALAAEYQKTHLIPFLERYHPGPGALPATALGPWRLGGMICQDDNFTDLSRAYGRRRAQLVAVPTNDWRQVRRFHFSNTRWRAVESRYAVVRAASNGLSAIVSPRGEVLAVKDHFVTGPAVVVADVALEAGGSAYAHTGDWVMLGLAGVLLAGGAVVNRRRRLSPAR
ncbi:MAG TPA: nitrilase-related carbon-nitrogen hydrolase [Polyangia bacterium]|jgi:apolipoprotein N-acyltransferase